MLLTFFIAVPVFSKSVVESEFELLLPRQFQQELIEKKWKTLLHQEFQGNWQFPDQRIESQGIPVDIRGISLQVKSQMDKPVLDTGQTLLALKSRGLQAVLTVKQVSVDHIIERNVGGIVGRFRVRAQCDNLIMSLKSGDGVLSIGIKPQLGASTALAVVQDVDLTWSPGGWVVSPVDCQGVQGFDAVLLNEVQKIFADSLAFLAPQKELMKEYVAEQLGKVSVDFLQRRQRLATRPDISVVMIVQDYIEQPGAGILVRGLFEISFERVKVESRKFLSLSHGSEVASGRATLRLPADFVATVMTEAYRANTWLHKITSLQLPGFSSVMNSRLVQFLVWHELINYSKSAKFLFDIYSDKDLAISGQGTEYQLSSRLRARMQAPKGGSHIPFMNFTLPFKSHVQLQVQNGVALAKLVSPKLDLMASYDADYVRRYSPSRRFSASTIRHRLAGALYGGRLVMKIPEIPLTEGMSLRVRNLKITGDSELLLEMAP